MRSHAEESERAMHPEDAACIVFAAYQYDGSAFSRAAEFSEKGRLGRGHLRSGKAFPPKLKRDSRFLSYFKREGFELDEHLLGHMGGKPLPVGRWRTGLQSPLNDTFKPLGFWTYLRDCVNGEKNWMKPLDGCTAWFLYGMQGDNGTAVPSLPLDSSSSTSASPGSSGRRKPAPLCADRAASRIRRFRRWRDAGLFLPADRRTWNGRHTERTLAAKMPG